MIIADTGFWLALANRRDACHPNAVRALDAVGDERLILTWPVMTETRWKDRHPFENLLV